MGHIVKRFNCAGVLIALTSVWIVPPVAQGAGNCCQFGVGVPGVRWCDNSNEVACLAAGGIPMPGQVCFPVFGLCGPKDPPTTVHVYNHNPGDDFDDNAEGLIWQRLGLLDAFGRPLDPIPPKQIIRDADNNIVGYRSADGTQEAYNVNSSFTTDQAWQRVADGGTLHIVKHGASGDIGRGGGIRLDNGALYDGFDDDPDDNVDDSTRAGYGAAYQLTPRPDANITVNLNSCWSSNDPDGDGAEQPATSVTDSARRVNGVGTVQGHSVVVYAKVSVGLTGGTAALQLVAAEALQDAARTAGFPPPPTDGTDRAETTNDHIPGYVANLPFSTRYATVQGIVDRRLARLVPPVAAGTVRITLTYVKDLTAPVGGAGSGGTHVHPTQFTDQATGRLDVWFNEEYVTAYLELATDTLEAPAVFHANMLSELPAPPPLGHALVSGVFDFAHLGGGSIVSPLTIGIGFDSASPDVDVLWYDPAEGFWGLPLGSVSFDWQNNTALVSTLEMGVYAVFGPAGACCLSDGTCADGLTTTECGTVGGTHQGAGTTCLGDTDANGIDDACEEQPIPTVSEWGLIVTTLLLLAGAKIYFGRRRGAARTAA